MRAGHAAELKKKAGINAPFLDEGAEALGHLRHHPSRYASPESLVVSDLYEELRCHVLKTVTTLLRACPKVSAGIQNIEPRTQNAVKQGRERGIRKTDEGKRKGKGECGGGKDGMAAGGSICRPIDIF